MLLSVLKLFCAQKYTICVYCGLGPLGGGKAVLEDCAVATSKIKIILDLDFFVKVCWLDNRITTVHTDAFSIFSFKTFKTPNLIRFLNSYRFPMEKFGETSISCFGQY